MRKMRRGGRRRRWVVLSLLLLVLALSAIPVVGYIRIAQEQRKVLESNDALLFPGKSITVGGERLNIQPREEPERASRIVGTWDSSRATLREWATSRRFGLWDAVSAALGGRDDTANDDDERQGPVYGGYSSADYSYIYCKGAFEIKGSVPYCNTWWLGAAFGQYWIDIMYSSDSIPISYEDFVVVALPLVESADRVSR